MVAGIRKKGEPTKVLGCPTCMQAKFTRFPFSSSEATAKAPLDELVMDVVGPLKLGAAGAKYFLTIVDVYTRMTWVYVLSKKSDVAEMVKNDWLPMVDRNKIGYERTAQSRRQHSGCSLKLGYPSTSGLMRCGDWKAENEAKIGVRFGEVKSSGLEHVELPLELSSGSTTTRQYSLVNGEEEAKDAEEEEEEVQQSSNAEEWKKAIESKLKSIEENGTWELRYKSRLVAKGYQQKEKVDFKELFASVVKPTALTTLLVGAAIQGWVVKQMDITTAFLNGVLEEEIFMA
ncbi:unnamed protein product [Closterium sp. NIES-54]